MLELKQKIFAPASEMSAALDDRENIQRFVCQHCGGGFIPSGWSPAHLNSKPPKYCSRACCGKAHRKRVVIACSNANCRNLKEKPLSELKRNPCCDRYCSNEWRRVSGISAGKNNPAWRGGISYRYRGENWDEQREYALDRDKYTCQRCSLTHEEIKSRNLLPLEVHHIIPYHLFPHYLEANSLDNLKTLCRVCHMIEEHEFIKAHPEEPSLRRIPKTTPQPKLCIDCHQIFQPLTHSEKACNVCMIIKCFNCGKDHRVKEYHMKKFQRFCSAVCVTEYIGQNNRKIDQVKSKEMKALRDLGLSYKEIATKLHCSKYAVRINLIKSYGFNAVEHQLTHVDTYMFEEMKRLRNQGLSTRKIAAVMKLGKSTVASWLKGYNAATPIQSKPNPS